jgi:hypothetical protein
MIEKEERNFFKNATVYAQKRRALWGTPVENDLKE